MSIKFILCPRLLVLQHSKVWHHTHRCRLDTWQSNKEKQSSLLFVANTNLPLGIVSLRLSRIVVRDCGWIYNGIYVMHRTSWGAHIVTAWRSLHQIIASASSSATRHGIDITHADPLTLRLHLLLLHHLPLAWWGHAVALVANVAPWEPACPCKWSTWMHCITTLHGYDCALESHMMEILMTSTIEFTVSQ